MDNQKGIILFDTFEERQETIIRHIKPKSMPHTKVFGIRQDDDPTGYMQRNKELIETYKKELAAFLQSHPQSIILTNYYFGILPEIWDFISENKENIANVFVVTCQDDFYTTHAQPNNYPIKPNNIIAYSDDHGRWKDDLRDALLRSH